MSNTISPLYDALVTLIETQVPNRIRLTNPYNLEENNELFLSNGWALAIANGTNTERQISGSRSLLRVFNVALTNKITTTEHNIDDIVTLEKTLILDFEKIMIALENDPDLGGESVNAKNVNDTGIRFLETERNKYLVVDITVECEYFRSPT